MPTPVPDLIEPIVAYRAWRYSIDERGARIFALGGHEDAWDGACRGWVVASCSRFTPSHAFLASPASHPAPKEGCSCGFYALKSIDVATEILAMVWLSRDPATQNHLGSVPGGFDRQGEVFGRVELAGKVVEHGLGYRAQRARVLDLIPMGSDDHAIASLALRLQVPLAAPIDEGSIDRAVEAFNAAFGGPLQMPRRGRPLSLFERLRLLTHQRLFRVIQGGAAASESS
jgi:hypothetical protein